MTKFDRIQPAQLRLLVAQSQIDQKCNEELGECIVRIHDIVKKCCSFFKTCTREELEEATSWSYERWMAKGIPHVDLQKYSNPFSYFYRGSFQNMMNRILQMRRKQLKKEQYEQMVKETIANELPSTQVKDLTSLYD